MGCPVYFLTKKGYPGQVTAILPPPDAPPGASRRRHPGFCHTARGADISVFLIEICCSGCWCRYRFVWFSIPFFHHVNRHKKFTSFSELCTYEKRGNKCKIRRSL